MDPWALVTHVGLPEAWAAISLGMVITYFIMRFTRWKEPSDHREAFKAAAVLLALTLTMAFVTVRVVKEATQVPRPCTPCSSPEMSACLPAPLGVCPDGSGEICLCPEGCNPYCIDDDYSFPSGHAAAIFSVATLAFLLLRRREGLLLYLPAGLVAYSRVALGVHTMSDIGAGALVGIVSALVIWKARPKMGILA